jgi:hypothetical protein
VANTAASRTRAPIKSDPTGPILDSEKAKRWASFLLSSAAVLDPDQNVLDPDQDQGEHEIAFEAYGVRLAVTASRAELLDRVRPFLPPGWQSCSPVGVECRFSLSVDDSGSFVLERDGDRLSGGKSIDLDLVLDLLDTQLRLYLGTNAPDWIFIHAGVVAHQGRALVLPSRSFAGKTTLVAALLREGAVYYSDEFAVIDREGLVHPYPKPLSVRNGGWEQIDHTVETLGGVAGDEAVPVAMVVVTSYDPGAQWNPRQLSAGAGAMALLSNAVPAQERPKEVMHAVSRAAKDAIVLEGDRGEADEVAPLLLAELEHQTE